VLDDSAVLKAARLHARARFEQGLQAADVLTEFRLLRQEIWRALRLHRADDVSIGDLVATELLVHDALDGAIGPALAALGRDLDKLREEMLATTVHDVQQPITGLKDRLQLALRTLSAPATDAERVAKMIRRAEGEADRMSALVASVRATSRVALGRLR
jgi:signal transduction histidine kinase